MIRTTKIAPLSGEDAGIVGIADVDKGDVILTDFLDLVASEIVEFEFSILDHVADEETDV
jgi:hypothetical protein